MCGFPKQEKNPWIAFWVSSALTVFNGTKLQYFVKPSISTTVYLNLSVVVGKDLNNIHVLCVVVQRVSMLSILDLATTQFESFLLHIQGNV